MRRRFVVARQALILGQVTMRRMPRAIVFVDEVGKSRESRLRASNDEREQNQLLAELDGFEGPGQDGGRREEGEGRERPG